MVTYFRWVGGRLVVASMFVAIVAGGGGSSDLFAVKAAHAAVSASGGTTNKADLPAMAAAKVKAMWPGWTITSSALRANGFVAVAGRNAKGNSGVWSVEVVQRNENGKIVYYCGNVRGPN